MVELIVGATVMALITVSILSLLVGSLYSISLGKDRSLGLALANEKLEYLRDLPYDSLATQHGTIYPPGSILDDENVTRNNVKFRVHTVIDFVDDPYDGNAAGTIPGKPTDLYPYDYKKAQISIYLVNSNAMVATLTTNLGAKAAETASNTGILQISVQDANGHPVANANVQITNANVSPAVNISTTTDNTGQVEIPKLPPDNGGHYQIIASLGGYSTAQTYADPSGSQTPVNPNPNVLVQKITNVTLSIDRVASLTAHVVDTSGTPIASQSVTVTGTKKIYTNPDVYAYSAAQTTDASGNFTVSGLTWDSYNVSVPAGKYIVSVSPIQPVAVNPNTSVPVTIVLTSSSSWPTIGTISPSSDNTGSNPTTITITGSNFAVGSTVTLAMAGQRSLAATSVTRNSSTSLTANFNLTGAATGNWDVVVTSGGNQATETGGFNVTP